MMMVRGREKKKKNNDLLLELDGFIFSGWFKWLFCFCFCKQIKNGLKVSMNHRFNAFMNYNFEFYLTFFFFRVWMVYWDYTLILLNSSRKKKTAMTTAAIEMVAGIWPGLQPRLLAKLSCGYFLFILSVQ